MDVGPGGRPGVAGPADDLPLLNLVPRVEVRAGKVRDPPSQVDAVGGAGRDPAAGARVTGRGLDLALADRPLTGTAPQIPRPVRVADHAIFRGEDRCPHWCAVVDVAVAGPVVVDRGVGVERLRDRVHLRYGPHGSAHVTTSCLSSCEPVQAGEIPPARARRLCELLVRVQGVVAVASAQPGDEPRDRGVIRVCGLRTALNPDRGEVRVPVARMHSSSMVVVSMGGGNSF